MTINKILAGDIGGSHITAALFENTIDKASLLELRRKTVDSQGPKEEILNAWITVIQELIKAEKNIMLGLAMPAPFDYKKGIFWIKDQGKFLSLFGVELKKELSQRLDMPTDRIYFVNDAEAFLRGESTYGGGVGHRDLMGITLGSGLGTSFKIKGEFTDAGLWTEPFKGGIAEDYLGTVWFIDWAEKNLHKKYKGLKELLSDVSDREILKPAFQEYASNLAEFIYDYDLKYNFDHVVIGGNIIKAKELFEKELKSSLFKLGYEKSISFSVMGEKSALFGVVATLSDENNELVKPLIRAK